jgi:hypothetical protein
MYSKKVTAFSRVTGIFHKGVKIHFPRIFSESSFKYEKVFLKKKTD